MLVCVRMYAAWILKLEKAQKGVSHHREQRGWEWGGVGRDIKTKVGMPWWRGRI